MPSRERKATQIKLKLKTNHVACYKLTHEAELIMAHEAELIIIKISANASLAPIIVRLNISYR